MLKSSFKAMPIEKRAIPFYPCQGSHCIWYMALAQPYLRESKWHRPGDSRVTHYLLFMTNSPV